MDDLVFAGRAEEDNWDNEVSSVWEFVKKTATIS
jgi:hypothetical protein